MKHFKQALILILTLLLISSAGCTAKTPRTAALTPEKCNAAAEKPRFDQDWQLLYYEELASLEADSAFMFNLCDLDGDGIPELMFSGGDHHGTAASLYTVSNGELINLGEFGSFGEFQFDFKLRLLHSGYTQSGNTHETVYSLEASEMTDIISFSNNSGSSLKQHPIYKISDKEVSESDYKTQLSKYSFHSRKSFKIRKYDISELRDILENS